MTAYLCIGIPVVVLAIFGIFAMIRSGQLSEQERREEMRSAVQDVRADSPQ